MLASLLTTAIVPAVTATIVTRMTGLPMRISPHGGSTRSTRGTTTVASPSTAFPARAVRQRL